TRGTLMVCWLPAPGFTWQLILIVAEPRSSFLLYSLRIKKSFSCKNRGIRILSSRNFPFRDLISALMIYFSFSAFARPNPVIDRIIDCQRVLQIFGLPGKRRQISAG